MKNKNKKTAWIVSATMSLILCAGCAAKKGTPELYFDDSKKEIAISMFVQHEDMAQNVKELSEKPLNEKSDKTIILYSDSAAYYEEEGLSYRELLLKRMKSEEADDIFLIPAEDVLEFDRLGYFYDLSQLECIQNLSDEALLQSTYNGKVFSIPLYYTCFGWIWNVDMLHEYQLEIPENLGEFLTVCETLKQNGIVPYGANMDFGLCVPAMCVGLDPIYKSADRDQILEDLSSGKTPVSTYMRDGFTFLQEMIDAGYMDPDQALNTKPGEEIQLFSDGKCAFISSICRAKAFRQNYPFEIEMTALPVLENGAVCVEGADQRVAINPDSEHLEDTITVLNILGSTDFLNAFAKKYEEVSSARGSQNSVNPQAASIAATMVQGGQIPNQDFALHFNVWNRVKELGGDICRGMSVDEVCARYDAIQMEEIELYQK